MENNYCFEMIKNLRQHEDILLFGNILTIKQTESEQVINFLKEEYQQEAFNYPYMAPLFDEVAALWSAKTIYISAQLILYRGNREADLNFLLPDFSAEINASAILSIDLCLRFLPSMIFQLKLIDPDDILIPILEHKLYDWHYSGVSYPLDIEKIDFKNISVNECLQQLYCDRIVQNKKIQFALHPVFKETIQANMGIFTNEFWNEFKTATTIP